jgi:hypothetical protein
MPLCCVIDATITISQPCCWCVLKVCTAGCLVADPQESWTDERLLEDLREKIVAAVVVSVVLVELANTFHC